MARRPVLLRGQKVTENGSANSLLTKSKRDPLPPEQDQLAPQKPEPWMQKSAPGIQTLKARVAQRLVYSIKRWGKKLLPDRKGRSPHRS